MQRKKNMIQETTMQRKRTWKQNKIAERSKMTEQNKRDRQSKRTEQKKILEKGVTVLLVILGNMLYALSAKLFLLPAGLMTGGTTGIALVVNRYTGMSVSAFVLIFNIVMLLLGLAVLGKQFALTTVLSSFAYPISLEFFDRVLGDFVPTEDLWLCAVFFGLGVGISLGIVIRAGASTGGMDIPPLILNHYLRIPVSAGLLAFDIILLLLQAIDSPVENLLYGIVLMLIYTLVLDKMLLMGTTKTEVKVVSSRHEEIRREILRGLDRGVTMLSAESGYLGEKTQMIFSVISNRELPRLERIIHEIDPDSFMVVSRVSEVRGRGFSMKKEYR